MKNLLNQIYSSGLKFLEPLSTEDTYAIIVKEALRLVNADQGSISLVVHKELEKVYSTTPFLYRVKARKNGITYHTFKTRQPKILNIKESLAIHPELKDTQIKSSIFIPLSYKNKSIGVLSLDSYKKEEFTSQDMDALKLFASMATLAIRKTQLYNETKDALETRDLFIALASHELRTPLTTINGYIQLLKTKLDSMPQNESRWIEEMSWECTRLTNLVKELLELNLVKSGRLEFTLKECSLSHVINRVINEFRFAHPDRNIIFTSRVEESRDMVIGDFDKLMQALSNLVNNAVKFSSPETNVKIELKSAGDDLKISVVDQGEGINQADLPRIAEEFYKGADNLKEGMGIGLFLAKYIVNRHQGLLKIESEPKKGTKVEVTIPEAKL